MSHLLASAVYRQSSFHPTGRKNVAIWTTHELTTLIICLDFFLVCLFIFDHQIFFFQYFQIFKFNKLIKAIAFKYILHVLHNSYIIHFFLFFICVCVVWVCVSCSHWNNCYLLVCLNLILCRINDHRLFIHNVSQFLFFALQLLNWSLKLFILLCDLCVLCLYERESERECLYTPIQFFWISFLFFCFSQWLSTTFSSHRVAVLCFVFHRLLQLASNIKTRKKHTRQCHIHVIYLTL